MPSTVINNTRNKDAIRFHEFSQNATLLTDVTFKQHMYIDTRLFMHNAVKITANAGTHYR